MTLNFSYRLTAVTMAMLMLLSSTGFSMDAHYCQNKIQSVSFWGQAKSCHEKQTAPSCHKTKKTCQHPKDGLNQNGQNNCCHNESIVIEKSDLDATSPILTSGQNSQFDFLAAFFELYVFNSIPEADFQPYAHYKPPLPDRDVQVLYQIFLI